MVIIRRAAPSRGGSSRGIVACITVKFQSCCPESRVTHHVAHHVAGQPSYPLQTPIRQAANRVIDLFPSLKGYQRSWLARDLLSGLTIAAIAIPGQIAVAKLAGMPPTTGLWVAIVAGFVALLFVANRQIWFGSDSTTAPLIIAGLGVLAVPASDQYVALAVTLAILVGVLICIVAFANMLWLAELMSRTVIAGFMAGVAVIIIVGQLPALFGIPAGGTHTLQKLWHVVTHLSELNPVATVVGLASLIALPLCTRINRRLPGALLVVSIATLATALLSLTRFDVQVLGTLQGGLPHPVMPNLSLDAIRAVLPTAFAIALISIAQTGAVARSNADATGDPPELKSSFTGLGIANLASAATGSFSVDSSAGATAVNNSSEQRSQLGAGVGALALLLVVLFATSLVADLPEATLAAIMIVMSARIINLKELRRIGGFSTEALALAIGTFAAVVVLGVESGVLIAVVFTLVTRAIRSSRPEITVLGRRADGHWLPDAEEHAEPADGVLVIRLNGPVWFANANWFHDQVVADLETDPSIRGIVIDTVTIDDLDYTGASVLKDLVIVANRDGIVVAVTHVKGRTDDSLRRIKLTSVLPQHQLFESVEDAYQYVQSTLAQSERPGTPASPGTGSHPQPKE